jgi:hypothetical protein
MAKLNRIYRLTIQTQDTFGNPTERELIVTNPITIEFKVDRSIYAGLNSLDLNIYNLSPNHRNLLFQDVYGINYKNVILEAGYSGQGMTVIFNGNVWSAYSYRRGVNVVTHIHAIDGLSAQSSRVKTTLKSGTPFGDIITNLMGSLKDLKSGTLALENKTFNRPVVLNGNAFRLLRTYTNDNVFIDTKTINIMRTDDVIEGYVPLLTDSSGLLGTPERKDATLTASVIFEPRLLIGQVIELKSSIAPQFDGQYKIYGIQHAGIISDSIAGNCTTTIQVQVGSQVFGRFNVLKAEQRQIVS